MRLKCPAEAKGLFKVSEFGLSKIFISQRKEDCVCVTVGTCMRVCMCVIYLWTQLIAFGLPQAEFCQSDLHGVDDGEAAVLAQMWHHHGEASLWTLRHDVTGFPHEQIDTCTDRRRDFTFLVLHNLRNSLLTLHVTKRTESAGGSWKGNPILVLITELKERKKSEFIKALRKRESENAATLFILFPSHFCCKETELIKCEERRLNC